MTAPSSSGAEKLKIGEAQRPQKWRTAPRGVRYRDADSAGVSHAKVSGEMKATVVNAAPWTRRQNAQWQLATGPNDAVTRYRKWPQRHPPVNSRRRSCRPTNRRSAASADDRGDGSPPGPVA